MGNVNTNPNSHLTAKERDKLSYPARLVNDQNLLIGKVLDFGCGYGNDVKVFSEKGIDITGYDKHYFPEFPTEKFDTIICFYVLNVLRPQEQAKVLMELSQLIKPGGKVYIAVRRDLKYEGFRMHKLHQKKTYQCNVILNYRTFFKNQNCEIYEYQHFNQIQREQDSECPFCYPSSKAKLIVESATAYAIFDKYPVNKGHALIIPKKHCADYFELSFRDQAACIFMINEVKSILDKKFNPDGYNVGINIGEKAGQTVHHVHIHLIPRYDKDVEDPRGGVRGVIPEKQKY